MPAVGTVAYVPTLLVAVAVVVTEASPVTPALENDSPFTKPLIVLVKVGLAAPYTRESLSAVTVNEALFTVSVPSTKETA